MEPTKKGERYLLARVKGFNDAGELEALASTPALDRDEEIIEPAAWAGTLDVYRSNPAILAAHLHRLTTGFSPVIGSASRIEATDEGLPFAMTFATTPLAADYEKLYRERHMRAFSVGFYTRAGRWDEYTPPGEEDAKSRRIYIHTECELLEISAVAVGSNPEALVRMRELMRAPQRGDVEEAITVLKRIVEGGQTDINKRLEDALTAMRSEVREVLDEIVLLSDPLGLNAPPAPAAADEEAGGDGGAGAPDAGSEAARRLAAALRTT